jgi:hypothetical protein
MQLKRFSVTNIANQLNELNVSKIQKLLKDMDTNQLHQHKRQRLHSPTSCGEDCLKDQVPQCLG